MQQTEQIGELTAALAKAQASISNPELDRVNPHFKNRYASLASHLDAIRKPFAENGLALVQSMFTEDRQIGVTTQIAHASGQFMRSTVMMPLPDRPNAQQIGACVTYLRRYALAAMTLIVGDEDDDGEADRNARQSSRPAAAPPAPAQRREDSPEPKETQEAPAAEPRKKKNPDLSVFDSTAVKRPEPMKALPRKTWPDEGNSVVNVDKIVARENHMMAVLCTHPILGKQWVSFDQSQLNACVKIGHNFDLRWRFSPEGFYECVSATDAPRMADYKGELPLY